MSIINNLPKAGIISFCLQAEFDIVETFVACIIFCLYYFNFME